MCAASLQRFYGLRCLWSVYTLISPSKWREDGHARLDLDSTRFIYEESVCGLKVCFRSEVLTFSSCTLRGIRKKKQIKRAATDAYWWINNFLGMYAAMWKLGYCAHGRISNLWMRKQQVNDIVWKTWRIAAITLIISNVQEIQ